MQVWVGSIVFMQLFGNGIMGSWIGWVGGLKIFYFEGEGSPNIFCVSMHTYIYYSMKSSKIKFHHKKNKLSRIVTSDEKLLPCFEPHQIGFLLKENVDTEHAKNQLRQASQEQLDFPRDNQFTMQWIQSEHKHEDKWLAAIQLRHAEQPVPAKNQSKSPPEVVVKPSLHATVSYGEFNPQKKLELINKFQLFQQRQKDPFYNGSQLKLRNLHNHMQRFKTDAVEELLDKNRFYKRMKEKTEQDIKNKSLSALKCKNRVVLVTPKVSDNFSNEEAQKISRKGELPKQKVSSSIYIKGPDCRKDKQSKRSVTVHSDSRQQNKSFLDPGKKNFYLKNTTTICVLQKAPQPDPSINMNSNYVSLPNSRNRGMSKCKDLYKDKIKESDRDEEVLVRKNREWDGLSDLYAGRNEEQRMRNIEDLERANLEKLHIQKTVKTMMLRHQFERLRRILKKQSTLQFRVQHDHPMKIIKL